MENECQETKRLVTRKPFFVLESLSFKNLNSSTNLNCNFNESNGFDNGDDDVLTNTSTGKIENHLPHVTKNRQTENSIEDVSDTISSNAIATLRPHFILESLAFTAINKVNSCDIESKITNICNKRSRSISKEAAIIPQKRITVNCEGCTKTYPQNLSKGKLFYVLESLTYNESGVLKIISKNISNETSYEICHINNAALFKQINQSNVVMPRHINESPTNISKAKCKKYQSIRKEPYSNPSSKKTNSCCRLHLSRMVKSKDFLFNYREQDEINKYLLLEDDPVRFEILKTVRQPYILLDRLPEQF